MFLGRPGKYQYRFVSVFKTRLILLWPFPGVVFSHWAFFLNGFRKNFIIKTLLIRKHRYSVKRPKYS